MRTGKCRKLTGCCWLVQGQIVSMSRSCTCWRNIRSIKNKCRSVTLSKSTNSCRYLMLIWVHYAVTCPLPQYREKWSKTNVKFFTTEICITFSIQFLLVKKKEKTVTRRELIDELNFLWKKTRNKITMALLLWPLQWHCYSPKFLNFSLQIDSGVLYFYNVL